VTCRIDDFRLNRAPLFASVVGLQGDLDVPRIAREENRVLALDLTEVELVDCDAVKLRGSKGMASNSGTVQPASANGPRESEAAPRAADGNLVF
jgi:hypothetical protein